MESLRQYVFSIVAATVICGMITALIPQGTMKEIIKLLGGIILTLTLLRPISDIQINWQPDMDLIPEKASYAVNQGEKMAQEALADIIKTKTEAYILDKAAELNTQIDVEISLNSENIPITAAISGKVSPYQRKQIEYILISQIGITKENQVWTG